VSAIASTRAPARPFGRRTFEPSARVVAYGAAIAALIAAVQITANLVDFGVYH
jgi:hypothetical protein